VGEIADAPNFFTYEVEGKYNGQGTRDKGQGTRYNGQGTRDNGQGTMDNVQCTMDKVRGTRYNGQWTRCEVSVFGKPTPRQARYPASRIQLWGRHDEELAGASMNNACGV